MRLNLGDNKTKQATMEASASHTNLINIGENSSAISTAGIFLTCSHIQWVIRLAKHVAVQGNVADH